MLKLNSVVPLFILIVGLLALGSGPVRAGPEQGQPVDFGGAPVRLRADLVRDGALLMF